MRWTPSIAVLIVANLSSLIGVVWWDWPVFAVMLLFWLENIIVGLLNIPRILFASGDTDKAEGALPARLFTAVFFTLHYGMFTFGHGVFVFSMFGQGIDEEPSLPIVLQLIEDYQLYWMVLALFASHAFSLVLNYFLSGEYRAARVKKMMIKPYSRIVILHVGILIGGALLQFLDEPLLGLVVLVVVKIVVDIKAHLKEHQSLSATVQTDSQSS